VSRHEDAHELDTARRKVEQLHTALETRHTIGVAQGLLMARYQLTTEQAFEYLRRSSQESNVKLRQLADGVVGDWHEVGCRLDEFHPQLDDEPLPDASG
jgi:AmiR/NasT family two-component response regulator